MSEKEPIDPKVKGEINNEGFEGNAAVLVGKKEEMDTLKQKLESEGKTADLATFIKLHKTISIPIGYLEKSEFRDNSVREKGVKGVFDKGNCVLSYDSKNEKGKLSFFDSDYNWASVDIDPEKIASLASSDSKYGDIRNELEQLGFHFIPAGLIEGELRAKEIFYRNALEEESRQRKIREFDF